MNEEPTVFPKQIKIDDYEPAFEGNLIRIMETSNMLLGDGGRSSTTAIVLAKALHLLHDEGTLPLQGKQLLELGCGVGLVGIYLGCLGANVVLTDLPQLREMVERNININRELIQGEVGFAVLNWNKDLKKEGVNEKEEGTSTTSSELSSLKALEHLDLAIICEAGSIKDLALQLKWMGREGALLAFMERSYISEQHLNLHELEPFLIGEDYEFEKFDTYHPDYEDARIHIYRIWK